MSIASPRIAALPMYDIDHGSVERLWDGLAGHLESQGIEIPARLDWPDRLDAHWRRPDLLLSQTCGYPLVEELAGDVGVVGAFHFAIEGCSGFDYSSRIVVRDTDGAREIADFRGRIAAFNGANSQSGYNSLRALVAPLARGGRFFAATVESGAHRRSLDLIRSGKADIAAIDCVSFALVERFEPAALDGLATIGWTAAAPGLPLITAGRSGADELERLRIGIEAALADPDLAPAREALFIAGFSRVDLADYRRCTQMKAEAVRLGFPVLA